MNPYLEALNELDDLRAEREAEAHRSQVAYWRNAHIQSLGQFQECQRRSEATLKALATKYAQQYLNQCVGDIVEAMVPKARAVFLDHVWPRLKEAVSKKIDLRAERIMDVEDLVFTVSLDLPRYSFRIRTTR